jgi:hypothetical protein
MGFRTPMAMEVVEPSRGRPPARNPRDQRQRQRQQAALQSEPERQRPAVCVRLRPPLRWPLLWMLLAMYVTMIEVCSAQLSASEEHGHEDSAILHSNSHHINARRWRGTIFPPIPCAYPRIALVVPNTHRGCHMLWQYTAAYTHQRGPHSLSANHLLLHCHFTLCPFQWHSTGSQTSVVLVLFCGIAVINLSNCVSVWTGRARRSTVQFNMRLATRQAQSRHQQLLEHSHKGRPILRHLYFPARQRSAMKSVEQRVESHLVLRIGPLCFDEELGDAYKLTNVVVDPCTVPLSAIEHDLPKWRRNGPELASQLNTKLWGREQEVGARVDGDPDNVGSNVWSIRKATIPQPTEKKSRRDRHLGTINRKHMHRDIYGTDRYAREHTHLAQKLHTQQHGSFSVRGTHIAKLGSLTQVPKQPRDESFVARVTFCERISEVAEGEDSADDQVYEQRPSVPSVSPNDDLFDSGFGDKFHQTVMRATQNRRGFVEVTYV